jgi:hypothetical protein
MEALITGKGRKLLAYLSAIVACGCAGVLSSVAFFFVGLLLSLAGNAGLLHLGEYQPWLPLIGLEYGFVLGLIPGLLVARKVFRSRLRIKTLE